MNRSFSERMTEAKIIAKSRRDRGAATGQHKSWNYKRSELIGLDAIEAYFYQWRKDVQYDALTAVEYALFSDDYDELARIAELEFTP